jgi:hypothetical protein
VGYDRCTVHVVLVEDRLSDDIKELFLLIDNTRKRVLCRMMPYNSQTAAGRNAE